VIDCGYGDLTRPCRDRQEQKRKAVRPARDGKAEARSPGEERVKVTREAIDLQSVGRHRRPA
jgi:hypothetical protein